MTATFACCPCRGRPPVGVACPLSEGAWLPAGRPCALHACRGAAASARTSRKFGLPAGMRCAGLAELCALEPPILASLRSCQAPWCLTAAAAAASTGSRQVATGGQQKPPSPCTSALRPVALCIGGLSVLPRWRWLGSGRVGGYPCPGSGKAAERAARMGTTAGCLCEFGSAQGSGTGQDLASCLGLGG